MIALPHDGPQHAQCPRARPRPRAAAERGRLGECSAFDRGPAVQRRGAVGDEDPDRPEALGGVLPRRCAGNLGPRRRGARAAPLPHAPLREGGRGRAARRQGHGSQGDRPRPPAGAARAWRQGLVRPRMGAHGGGEPAPRVRGFRRRASARHRRAKPGGARTRARGLGGPGRSRRTRRDLPRGRDREPVGHSRGARRVLPAPGARSRFRRVALRLRLPAAGGDRRLP